jgi:ABC-type protease/lipase transport system fused ATPase/permease subunit
LLKASGCTVVVVTHRASLLNHVDKILFLRYGQVDGFGTKQEVFTRFLGQPKRTAVAHVGAGGMVTTSAEREQA